MPPALFAIHDSLSPTNYRVPHSKPALSGVEGRSLLEWVNAMTLDKGWVPHPSRSLRRVGNESIISQCYSINNPLDFCAASVYLRFMFASQILRWRTFARRQFAESTRPQRGPVCGARNSFVSETFHVTPLDQETARDLNP